MFQNTNTQIRKYRKTAYDKVPEGPNLCYIFETRIVQGYQKLYSHLPNKQIQIHKYTNTQINKCTNTAHDKLPEKLNMWYIFEKGIVQGYQKLYSHVSNAQMQNRVPERLNMWFIFEKAIVQGYLLNLAQLYKV